MKLIFLIICLTIVLLTLEFLIVSGFHTYNHRLLPLILGLLALFDFYRIVQETTNAQYIFAILEDLLLINLLDVIIYYILDFMRIKIKMIYNILLVSLLLLMNLFVIVQSHNPVLYKRVLFSFVFISVIGIITVILRSPKVTVSKQIKRNNYFMFISLIVPAITLMLTMIFDLDHSIYLPLSIDITCLILSYLFFTDRLRDINSVLKEELFHTLDIPAFLFDKDLFFLDASQKARELFPEHLEIIKASPYLFKYQEEVINLINNGGILEREINNRYYLCQIQKAFYKDKMKGYIMTMTDITNQKQETDIAKEIAQQKSAFLASMSHDLRSPLHAIIGSSEIVLSRIEMSERTRVMVNNIHDAGSNLLDIVNSILDFSKLESGKLNLHPTPYNFKKLIEDQSQIAFTNLKGKNVKFSFDIEDDYPEMLFGDELRVRQIIQNLISNAIKFTENGYIKCKIKVEIENKNQILLTYTVEDSGIGMTQEQMKSIFEDYVTYAYSQKKEGTGLGLSIVNKLSKLMGGNAKAESDGTNGSKLTVSFYQSLIKSDIIDMEKNGIKLQPPLHIYEESQLEKINIWKNENKPSYIYPMARVLVVDDMNVNLKIFKEISAPWKFKLDMCKDGRKAVELAKANDYDLIFLDQMMPIMSGTEAADEIQKFCKTPLILLTADITESMRLESKRHGFAEFMQKPIDISVLKQILEKYLPDEFKEEIDISNLSVAQFDNSSSEGYKKALTIYYKEMKELYELLPEYLKNDLNMFRNKVHGIKGISLQLGKENIALLAEIMEMAAINENIPFLNKYFDTFYKDMEFTISSVENELDNIAFEEISDDNNSNNKSLKENISTEELIQIFGKLIIALNEYEITETEEYIEQLNKTNIPNEILDIYNEMKYNFEEMEYEEAIHLVSIIISKLNNT